MKGLLLKLRVFPVQAIPFLFEHGGPGKFQKKGVEHFGLIREELSDIYSFCWWARDVETIVGACHGFFPSPDLREKHFPIYFI